MAWLYYITDTSRNKHQGTIHKIYKWIHSEVTNTSTLPLKYEGILSTQFISTGLLLYIIWIIIKLSSSSSHLHLQVIFITGSGSSLDHHWVIIIRSGSSLDLEHHWIWIISGYRSSLLDHHHRFYLLILFVTRISTEQTLFHVGCRPSLHVGLLQHLYLKLSHHGPPITYI